MPNTDVWQRRLQRLKDNRLFELIVVAIIILSALVIGAKTYDIDPFWLLMLEWADGLVTVFFVIEITIRFMAEENKKHFFKSAWNVFDTLIVVVSLIPINDSEMAMLGRLVRIFRVLRMVSIIPELRMLLNSLIKALPQLGYVLMLMFIIFYIYAAVGSTLFAPINPELWGDISISLLTLFRVMTFEDWTDVMYETMTVYSLSWIYYLSFIFFTAFAFLNMVIGIVVNVMEEESAKERERVSGQQPTMLELQTQLDEIKELLKAQRR